MKPEETAGPIVKVESQELILENSPQSTKDVESVAVPKTTAEENKHSAGQRQINFIWEMTQAIIALSIIWGSVGASIWIVVVDPMNRLMSFLFLSNVVSIVIGFYFGRTNHQRVGGVTEGR